jgi:putative flippase GtrA
VARSPLPALTAHIPPGQLGRYLLVGACNTGFAYGTFALFTYVLGGYIPASYLVASVLSSLLNITVSFLGYKWFVFRTRGNYLKEWLRSVTVYSGAIALGLLLLPPTVFAAKKITGNAATAPYIAGAILLGLQVIASFLGHKNFSFRNSGAAKSGPDA